MCISKGEIAIEIEVILMSTANLTMSTLNSAKVMGCTIKTDLVWIPLLPFCMCGCTPT